MAFFKSAKEALPAGLRLSEKAEESKWREKEFGLKQDAAKRASESHEASMEQHDWEKLDREKKEKWEQGDRLVRMARQRMRAGDEPGAVALYNKAYGMVPDGNEAMLIMPQSQPEYFKQLMAQGQIDPNLAEAKFLIVSKKHGGMPIAIDNIEDIDMMAAEAFDQANYLRMTRESKQRLADANANSKPYLDEFTGKWFVDSYSLDDNGIVRKGDPMPYVGAIPASEESKALRMLGIDPYSDKGREAKEVIYGLRGPKGGEPSEFTKEMAQEELGLKRKASGREEKRLGMADEAQTKEIELKEAANKREQEKHDLYMKTGGKTLSAKERADLYNKAEKAYRDNFFDDLKKSYVPDAPNKKKWIDNYMKDALGSESIKESSGEGLKKPGKKKSDKGEKDNYDEFIDDKTGDIMRVYPDGRREMYNKKGELIAKALRKAIKK